MVTSTTRSPRWPPIVPYAFPIAQTASAQPRSRRSVTSGTASVVKSWSGARPRQRGVPDGTADEGEAMAGGGEPLGEVQHRRVELEQRGGQAAARLLG